MLRNELLETLDLFDQYNMTEENQRELFENGLDFNFTYGDPDPTDRNQHLTVFGVSALLKTCQEHNVEIDANALVREPYRFPNEALIKEIASSQGSRDTGINVAMK